MISTITERKLRCLAVPLALLASSSAYGTGPQVKKIEQFVQCLNDTNAKAGPVDVSEAVKCIPTACNITLTMSPDSAQAACPKPGVPPASGALPTKCQLPRIILNCPGAPPFIPSFSLCPDDSFGAGNLRGSDRIEIGSLVTSRTCPDKLVMADVPIPPSGYKKIDPLNSVIGKKGDDKGCTDICHSDPAPKVGKDKVLLFPPRPIFGESQNLNNLKDYVIFTDLPEQTVAPTQAQRQTLSEICACIDEAVNDDADMLAGEFVTQKLCRALLQYQQTRGARSGAVGGIPAGQ